VTRNAVLGAPAQRRKVSLRDARLLPAVALVDPDLLAGLPQAVALASGLDALVQVIEPFVSKAANPLTDALCREAIPRGLAALPRLLDGEKAARADMALCSLFGGLALANAKLGAVHGLAGVIGGRTAHAHGAICGRLAPGVLALTEASLPDDHPARERFAAIRGWIATAWGGTPAAAFDTWAAFNDRHALPRLMLSADSAEIAAAALQSSSMAGAPVALAAEALTAVTAAA
jgi:alcohol dehydrogenase class IV